MEVLSRAATTVPTKAGGCGAHSGHALPATASVDDVSISFDAAGDPRASPALVAPAVAVPKKLLRCKRQVEVLLRSERNHVPSSTYIQDIQHGHSGMTRDWRQSLVEWVIEFMCDQGYGSDTYSLAVNFMDRFFSRVTVDQNCMQTLAIACCLAASKICAKRPIRIASIAEMFGNTVSIPHVKSVEVQVCSTLAFILNPCESQTFVSFLTTMLPEEHESRVRRHALLVADIAMAHYETLVFRPSVVAVASVLCSLNSLSITCAGFSAALEAANVGLSVADALPCAKYMHDLLTAYYPDMCRATSPTTVTEHIRCQSRAAASPAPSSKAQNGPHADTTLDADVDME